MNKQNRPARLKAALLALALALVLVTLLWRELREQRPAAERTASPAPTGQALIERGAYLARAGNCMACHTERGGVPYAGGRGIATPFGTVYAGNLTPDASTGIGAWSAEDFWQALRQGRSRDGLPGLSLCQLQPPAARRRRCDLRLPAQLAASSAGQHAA
jgi:mono/diheme cytochrome c family protein